MLKRTRDIPDGCGSEGNPEGRRLIHPYRERKLRKTCNGERRIGFSNINSGNNASCSSGVSDGKCGGGTLATALVCATIEEDLPRFL